jgi:2-polyprenyl-3-methyl-5-hydroxy-6-metoxy-1,4-benzoquinol methylase
MVYTSIEPTPGELSEYYSSYPASGHLSPITAKRYHELLDRFEPYRRSGRIIDVGCGAGLFLEVAASRGWEVHGTEFGERPVAACLARGIPIIEGALDPANYPPDHFDVVCSFEVIEHLAHPAEELGRMVQILRPGGLLYVTTPNFNCLARRSAPKNWNVANYPEHLSYFTPRTLLRMALEQDLEREWITTSGFSIYRWRTGIHQLSSKDKAQASKTQEDLRQRLESRWYLNMIKRTINMVLDLFNLGDSLKAGFRKRNDIAR